MNECPINLATPSDNGPRIASQTVAMLRILLLAVYGQLEPAERDRVIAHAQDFVDRWSTEPLP